MMRRLLAGVLLAAVAALGPIVHDSTLDHPALIPLSGVDDARVDRWDGESTLHYAARATATVHAAIYHCEPTAAQTWSTELLSVATGGAFPGPEGVLTPEGLRCGFCSQVSAVLAEVLRRNGIPSADVYGLDGHVVTRFEDAGRQYVVDADYGVGPVEVRWDDGAQLRTVAAVYPAGSPATLDRIYGDTSTDAAVPRAGLVAIAAKQETALDVVEGGRWVLLVVGLGLAAAGIAGRHQEPDETGQ